jgi:hypothetical protein
MVVLRLVSMGNEMQDNTVVVPVLVAAVVLVVAA